MSALSPDILMDPDTLDLPAFSRHVAGMEVTAQRVVFLGGGGDAERAKRPAAPVQQERMPF